MLALLLTLLLDAAVLLLVALVPPPVPPDPPAPVLLDAVVAVVDPPALLLVDRPPPPPDPELEAEDDASPELFDVVPAVVGGPLSPHPAANAALPVRTEASAKHEATTGPRGMVAIVPPSPDRPART